MKYDTDLVLEIFSDTNIRKTLVVCLAKLSKSKRLT